MSALEMSLEVMWKGMLAIIIVITIIIVSTYILHFVVKKIQQFKDKKSASNSIDSGDKQ